MRFSFLPLLIALFCDLQFVDADVDYESQVKPLLKARCYSCHGGLKQEAGLRLDTGKLLRKGGGDGSVIDSANPSNSSLIERVSADDESRMPPEGKPLTKAEIRILREWIRDGAPSPENERPEANPRDHWAFQKPARSALPSIPNPGWARNPVDYFVAAEQLKRGLAPTVEAEKRVLLRRVYLDLIGIPPTRQQMQAFLRDQRSDAYERVVEQLLASAAYGERWGRNWMDVWRYSDWYGRRRVPDCLNSYGQIWRWRDWIVRSLNEDKGYDRMVMEMLAADEICPDQPENMVATGFIVRNFYRWNYNTWMKDAVEHTGKAFLGLTLNCCHCHDHKYDPITNEEYFRFRAFFEPIEIRHDRVAGEPDPGIYPKYSYGKAYKPITSGLVRIMDEKLDAKTFVYTGGESRNVIPDRPPVTPGGPAVIGGANLAIRPVELPPQSWYPGTQSFIRQEALNQADKDVAAMKAVLAKAQQLVAAAKTPEALELAKLTLSVDQSNHDRATTLLESVKLRIQADQIQFEGGAGDAAAVSRAASAAERKLALDTVRVEQARAKRALLQAQRKVTSAGEKPNAKLKAELTKAETRLAAATKAVAVAQTALEKESSKYTSFGPQYPRKSTGRRTALAKWIANRENPLTARVAVNHIWARHFGRAIVESTENLGRNGARPSHPELLDWLAVELMDNGWRMKRIHRLIVTSSTYRLASHATREASQVNSADPDSIFLWKFRAKRMEAEVLRDSILAVSESLDAKLGGKEIDVAKGLTVTRRSLYFEHHGEGRMQWLDLFDAADPCDAYRRTSSVRPQQALALANSELAQREAQRLASRLNEDAANVVDYVDIAFQQVLARPPTPDEKAASLEFLHRQQRLFIESLPNEKRTPDAKTLLTQRAKVSFVHALFSHHDFITIR